MKTSLSTFALFALTMTAFAVYSQETMLSTEVRDMFGRATYSLPGAPSRPLQVGTVLPAGAVVRTGPGSAVDLRLGKESELVRLTQNTELELEQMASPAAGVSQIQLTVRQGTILGNLKPLGPEARLEVKTSNGVVSVRHGAYRINSAGYLVLLEGEMLYAFVPSGHDPKLFTLTAPPAIYFSPLEGTQPAPPPLVLEVQGQLRPRLR